MRMRSIRRTSSVEAIDELTDGAFPRPSAHSRALSRIDSVSQSLSRAEAETRFISPSLAPRQIPRTPRDAPGISARTPARSPPQVTHPTSQWPPLPCLWPPSSPPSSAPPSPPSRGPASPRWRPRRWPAAAPPSRYERPKSRVHRPPPSAPPPRATRTRPRPRSREDSKRARRAARREDAAPARARSRRARAANAREPMARENGTAGPPRARVQGYPDDRREAFRGSRDPARRDPATRPPREPRARPRSPRSRASRRARAGASAAAPRPARARRDRGMLSASPGWHGDYPLSHPNRPVRDGSFVPSFTRGVAKTDSPEKKMPLLLFRRSDPRERTSHLHPIHERNHRSRTRPRRRCATVSPP